ncbi:MAG: hypothetical protein OXG15_13865 [Gammaproteobacteria bacterium]|nr:hypothetical protein [Gammaproteobacteria bacterium]
MPLTRSTIFASLMIALMAGCSNFKHPLPWSHSPLHERLPGSWYAVSDSEPLIAVEVVKNEGGSLTVDMTFNVTDAGVDSDASQSARSNTERASFQGDVLAFNDVHVLQIDARTYVEEKSEEAEPNSGDFDGYRFLRVVSDDESIVLQEIDIEKVARLAAAQFSTEGATLTASEYASCVNKKIRTEIASSIVAEQLKERPTNWLSEDELNEMKEILKEFESRTVYPYRQLQWMRECIAYKLPGNLLGQLFSSDSAALFSAETFRLVKVN